MYQFPLSHTAQERKRREQAAKPLRTSTALPVPLPHMHMHEVPTLIHQPETLTVSIAMPCHRPARASEENQSRAKHLLHEVRCTLAASQQIIDMTSVLDAMAEALMQPEFWTHRQDGLVLFATHAGWHYSWVPIAVPEVTVIANRPHLLPFADLFLNDSRFYLLELTQHGVYLHAGTRFELRPLAIPDMLTSVSDAAHAHVAQRQLGVRTTHGAGTDAARYFGTVGDEHKKEHIAHYFTQVDATMCKILRTDHVPLILAGVDYLIPIYREHNHYAHLLDEHVSGNPDLLPTTILRDRACTIATKWKNSRVAEDVRFYSWENLRRTSTDLAVILPAVFQGRISELFIATGAQQWGTYLSSTNTLYAHDSHQPQDEDLLNLALIEALRTKAKVHVLPKEYIPGHSDIAAIFRF